MARVSKNQGNLGSGRHRSRRRGSFVTSRKVLSSQFTKGRGHPSLLYRSGGSSVSANSVGPLAPVSSQPSLFTPSRSHTSFRGMRAARMDLSGSSLIRRAFRPVQRPRRRSKLFVHVRPSVSLPVPALTKGRTMAICLLPRVKPPPRPCTSGGRSNIAENLWWNGDSTQRSRGRTR